MLDWNVVKDNKELIKKVEKLVDEVAEVYSDFPAEVCEELNRLTGNSWSGEEYIPYCAEYWSGSSLEETVYALFHDGELPDLNEKEIHILRPLEEIDMSPFEIRHVLATNKLGEDFNKKFESLPADEIANWFCTYFSDWEKHDYTKKDKVRYTFNFQGEREYGYERFVGMSVSEDKTGFVWSKNLPEEDWNAILAYFENAGGYSLSEE